MNGDTPGSGRRYRRIRTIADGGMGTVSLAVREEGTFRRVYAVKRLLPKYRFDDQTRAMFLDEARIAGLLHHPNVVSVDDVGEDDEGPYLVMDYVQGVSMADLIEATRQRGALVPLQVCVRIIKDVATGLHAAHELRAHDGTKLNLVHRDVSPQNVLIGYDGLARLTDFGIAKAIGGTSRTNTGVLKGKVGYLAPEQLQFAKPSAQTDIFSLGVVLYELLSADRLFAGEDDAETAQAILNEDPPDIDDIRSDVHPMLVETMYLMLAKEPQHRPEDANRVVERLDAVLSELVASEGSLSVSDHVSSLFAERRAEQKAEIDELTADLKLNLVPSKAPHARRRWIGLALVAAVVGAAWVAPSLFRRDASVVEDAPAQTLDSKLVVTQRSTAQAESADDTQPAEPQAVDETKPQEPEAVPPSALSATKANTQPRSKKRRQTRTRTRASNEKRAATVNAKPEPSRNEPSNEKRGGVVEQLMDWTE